ncbi:hypothetical protein PV10_03147 [Exophiala mesophila]|uniref:Tautomerase cis-CaaD-like domain-containing protein n=1 Tax=Exophiala mesophila TaxID=212818 RepID=A0A0D2A982_EXOME|nr:uncharacterized protein PV10_03147 [Exophiala mesophila]KIV95498.1 hypothetical protein PV10_03147 [Exophiala mesophila]
MPFYEIQHSHPLTATQKHTLARHITHLHSTTFLTPSLYVNVVFQYLAPTSTSTTYFLAGKPTAHHPAGPNRIFAMVRVSPQRTKADFDALALKIENKWYEVVNETDGSGDTAEARASKKMHFVVFHPMIAARENGVTIPDAGNEASWLKDNMPYFKSQAYEHGDQQFKDMLDEVESRADLKALLS